MERMAEIRIVRCISGLLPHFCEKVIEISWYGAPSQLPSLLQSLLPSSQFVLRKDRMLQTKGGCFLNASPISIIDETIDDLRPTHAERADLFTRRDNALVCACKGVCPGFSVLSGLLNTRSAATNIRRYGRSARAII